MTNLHQRLTSKLEQRERDGNLRKLQVFEGFTDFFSNDYLGFGISAQPIVEADNSVGSSRLIAGTTESHFQLEDYCSELFQNEKSLLFNTGYSANLGVLSSIPQKDDIILYDEHSHASIKDGIRLSLAKGIKFKHNDLSDLRNKLSKFIQSTVFVVVESLYSMDGDFATLTEISEICEKHNAHLIVDEAHSGGVFGENGSGYCADQNVKPFLKIITFGKAFGAHGACVVGNTVTIDFLINFSRPFIYTTALSAQSVNLSLQQLKRIDLKEKQFQLQGIINYFNEKFKDFNLESDLKSTIKSLVFKNRQSLKEIESTLHQKQFGVKAIYAPTVPKNCERLRVSLHAFNTKEEIDQLYVTLKDSRL